MIYRIQAIPTTYQARYEVYFVLSTEGTFVKFIGTWRRVGADPDLLLKVEEADKAAHLLPSIRPCDNFISPQVSIFRTALPSSPSARLTHFTQARRIFIQDLYDWSICNKPTKITML